MTAESEARADHLAYGDGMVGFNTPAERGGVCGVSDVAKNGHAFIERRSRGKANSTFFIAWAIDGHSGGIHHV